MKQTWTESALAKFAVRFRAEGRCALAGAQGRRQHARAPVTGVAEWGWLWHRQGARVLAAAGLPGPCIPVRNLQPGEAFAGWYSDSIVAKASDQTPCVFTSVTPAWCACPGRVCSLRPLRKQVLISLLRPGTTRTLAACLAKSSARSSLRTCAPAVTRPVLLTGSHPAYNSLSTEQLEVPSSELYFCMCQAT